MAFAEDDPDDPPKELEFDPKVLEDDPPKELEFADPKLFEEELLPEKEEPLPKDELDPPNDCPEELPKEPEELLNVDPDDDPPKDDPEPKEFEPLENEEDERSIGPCELPEKEGENEEDDDGETTGRRLLSGNDGLTTEVVGAP